MMSGESCQSWKPANSHAVLQVTTIKTVKQMEDLVDLGDGAAWYEKWRIKLTSLFHQVRSRHKHTREIFSHISILVCV